MNNLKYNIIKILSRLPMGGGNAMIVNALRKEGCVIGDGSHIFSNISAGEPYLVKIGNNCTISSEVIFLTHDASVGLFMGRENFSDICGRISIGDNCFIGIRTIILYGVSLPNNTIVAAGSVVTRSIKEPGCIIGGNPAKVIGKVSDFLERNRKNFLKLHGLNKKDQRAILMKNSNLVTRKAL